MLRLIVAVFNLQLINKLNVKDETLLSKHIINVNNKVFVLIPTIYHYQINMDNMP
jgi:hypothetical protein